MELNLLWCFTLQMLAGSYGTWKEDKQTNQRAIASENLGPWIELLVGCHVGRQSLALTMNSLLRTQF